MLLFNANYRLTHRSKQGYNILWISFMAALDVVASTVYFKIKYDNSICELVVNAVDLCGSCLIHNQYSKTPLATDIASKRRKKDVHEVVGIVNLEVREDEILYIGWLKTKTLRSVPNVEFETAQHEDNPTRSINICVDLPTTGKKGLVECVKVHVDIFTIFSGEISGIDPSVSYHQLNIEYWSFCSMCGSIKKARIPRNNEGSMKTDYCLLDAKSISDVKYTKWLSNVGLVKKASGKWKMCVDYTQLNKVCPEDLYQLPNIDKLVNSGLC